MLQIWGRQHCPFHCHLQHVQQDCSMVQHCNDSQVYTPALNTFAVGTLALCLITACHSMHQVLMVFWSILYPAWWYILTSLQIQMVTEFHLRHIGLEQDFSLEIIVYSFLNCALFIQIKYFSTPQSGTRTQVTNNLFCLAK